MSQQVVIVIEMEEGDIQTWARRNPKDWSSLDAALIKGCQRHLDPTKTPLAETLIYGRKVVEEVIGKYRKFAEESLQEGDTEMEQQWHKMVSLLEFEFLSDGCVIGPFDLRNETGSN